MDLDTVVYSDRFRVGSFYERNMGGVVLAYDLLGEVSVPAGAPMRWRNLHHDIGLLINPISSVYSDYQVYAVCREGQAATLVFQGYRLASEDETRYYESQMQRRARKAKKAKKQKTNIDKKNTSV